jgi:hypothetical protein
MSPQRVTLVLLTLAGAVACSDDSTPATTTMDAEAADVIGRQAADLFGGTASGLMAFDPDEAVLGIGYLIPTGPSLPTRRISLAPIARALAGRAPGCDPAQSDPTDTDGDGIYDDNIVTFTAANCTTEDESGLPLVATGTIRIQDQGSLFGWQVDFGNLVVRIGDNTDYARITVNGSYAADVGAAAASASQMISAGVVSSSEGTYTFSDDWTLGFTPDGNGVIPDGGPWPAGSFDLAGDFHFVRGGSSYALGLVTTAPLAIDGQCTGFPPFQSGQVVGAIVAHQSEGFVITFTGCGLDPTVEALANRLQ